MRNAGRERMFVSRIDQRIQTAALKGRIDASSWCHDRDPRALRPADLLATLKRRIYG
jgi:hypothetical protein